MAYNTFDFSNTHRNICDSFTSVFFELNKTVPEDTLFDENVKIFMKGIGRMFYIVDPKETLYNSPDSVPQFYRQAWPYFLLFIVLENLVLWFERKPIIRLNDGITSISLGVMQECGRLMTRGAESYMYVYLYENYRLFDLAWDSTWTWYCAAIGVDFCYYWVHRACHEVHILWAQHQVHHSSEDFNMTAGLRQSIFQGWCAFAFYLPLAVAIPPSHFVAHQQFNLLYQFWIHTEAVRDLGPLEWIFNTPKHHRVHHGSNVYCLDTNYGGVFIIWDRIFGTFKEESNDEEIIYGLVIQEPSFDVLHLESFYTMNVLQKFKSLYGWKNKLKAVFYGPSWIPGSPRLGSEENKIKVTKRTKYNVNIPLWRNVYLLVHFCAVLYAFQVLASIHVNLNAAAVLGFVLYIMASLTIFGMFFDNNYTAFAFEFLRCMILFTYIQRYLPASALPDFTPSMRLTSQIFFLGSGLFWFLYSIVIVSRKPVL